MGMRVRIFDIHKGKNCNGTAEHFYSKPSRLFMSSYAHRNSKNHPLHYILIHLLHTGNFKDSRSAFFLPHKKLAKLKQASSKETHI